MGDIEMGFVVDLESPSLAVERLDDVIEQRFALYRLDHPMILSRAQEIRVA